MADLKQIKELNEEKRRSARRKEFIMAELLETERSYVKVSITKYLFSRECITHKVYRRQFRNLGFLEVINCYRNLRHCARI